MKYSARDTLSETFQQLMHLCGLTKALNSISLRSLSMADYISMHPVCCKRLISAPSGRQATRCLWYFNLSWVNSVWICSSPPPFQSTLLKHPFWFAAVNILRSFNLKCSPMGSDFLICITPFPNSSEAVHPAVVGGGLAEFCVWLNQVPHMC